METVSMVLLAISPILIKVVTDGVKKISSIQFSENRVPLIRLIVACFALLAAIGTSIMGGEPVGDHVIGTFVDALIVFFAATGIHLFTKKK